MARQTKDSAHYVNNKEFTAELDKYSRKCRALMAKGKERPEMSRYLGECIIKMANRLSLRPNFVNYSYRDEKAFIACQKLLNGIPEDDDNPSIVNADRGIVVLHETMED